MKNFNFFSKNSGKKVKPEVALIILASVLLAIACVLLIPLGKIHETELSTVTQQCGAGQVQISFAPSFHLLREKSWPKVEEKGSPYGVGVMWVDKIEDRSISLEVKRLRLTGENGPSILLPIRQKNGTSQNTDGKFYTIVSYDGIDLPYASLSIDLECALHHGTTDVTTQTFTFHVKAKENIRWVNSLWESFKAF